MPFDKRRELRLFSRDVWRSRAGIAMRARSFSGRNLNGDTNGSSPFQIIGRP